MINDSAENAYRALGLSPDAGWADIRRSYMRLARQWHPDRYSATDAASVRIAEERFKELSAAYQYLVRARSRHRETPAAREPAARISRAVFESGQGAGHTWSPAWTTIGYVLLSGACALLPFFLYSYTSHFNVLSRDPPRTGGVMSKSEGGSGSSSVVAPPRVAQAGNTSGAWFAIAPIEGPAVASAGRYSGPIVGNRTYSLSHDSKSGPILQSPGVRQTTFSHGSTKADVRRIQGSPVFEGGSKWTYGPSYVYFDGDRVKEWYSSSAYPLRVSP